MKIKISKVDKLFSLYVRTKAEWTCQRCFAKFTPPTTGLHCSHFHGRGKKSVRFDLENVIAACFGCHQYLGSNPVDHANFFMKRLGEKKYNALMIRANTPARPDYKLLELWLKTELKALEESTDGPVFGRKAK